MAKTPDRPVTPSTVPPAPTAPLEVVPGENDFGILANIKRDLVMVRISELVPAQWNAPGRDDPGRVRALAAAIGVIGNHFDPIDVVHLSDRRLMIADGHRRVTASKEREETEIPAMKWDASKLSLADGIRVVQAIYDLRGLARQHSPADKLRAVLLGLDPRTVEQRKYRDLLFAAYGRDETRRLANIESFQTVPSTITVSRRFAERAYPEEWAYGDRQVALTKSCLEWIGGTKGRTQEVKDALRKNADPRIMTRLVKQYFRHMRKISDRNRSR